MECMEVMELHDCTQPEVLAMVQQRVRYAGAVAEAVVTCPLLLQAKTSRPHHKRDDSGGMKHLSAVVETTRASKWIQRCVVLVFAAVLYVVCSVLQVPVHKMTATGRSTSGNTPCDCRPDRRLSASTDFGRLFYNRVPKCGSTTLLTLMRRLAERNNYTHHNSKVYDRKNADEEEQRRIVEHVRSAPSPCSFDRHVFFVDFARFGRRPPVFINLVREPVERIISSFFYRRRAARRNGTRTSAYWLDKKFEHCVLTPDPECTFLEGHNYSMLQLPYFCGQEPRCQRLNDAGALARAKRNVERHFAVVGALEQMEATLRVLEVSLPRFFRGARQLYGASGVHRNQNPQKERVREEIKAVLRANLTAEYDLYRFVRQRLHRQYRELDLPSA